MEEFYNFLKNFNLTGFIDDSYCRQQISRAKTFGVMPNNRDLEILRKRLIKHKKECDKIIKTINKELMGE